MGLVSEWRCRKERSVKGSDCKIAYIISTRKRSESLLSGTVQMIPEDMTDRRKKRDRKEVSMS